ncbi:MAG: hypothetical protein N3D15_08445 [Syntrophorhabdaceae bacterium]|nr:hypothetical protein [Syntrophorhabdaceae bacterium]
MHDHKRPSVKAFFTNLHVKMPLWKKCWLLIRNNGKKIIFLKSCCGHPGEPGC